MLYGLLAGSLFKSLQIRSAKTTSTLFVFVHRRKFMFGTPAKKDKIDKKTEFQINLKKLAKHSHLLTKNSLVCVFCISFNIAERRYSDD